MRAGNSCKKSLSLREFSVRVLWVFLLIGCLASPAGAANFWDITVVDSDGGGGTSIASLPSGYPGISYGRGGGLRYAFYDGSTWQTEVVDSPGGGYTSLAVLPSGYPGISYRGGTNSDLKYAWYDGSVWQTTIVDSAGDVGWFTSLAILPSGYPAISYYDWGPNYNLKYAWYNGSTWQNTIVDNTGNVGYGTSLAVLPSTHPAIAYWGLTNRDLKYAWYDGATWQKTIVDSVGNVGVSPSLAILPSGYPAISYGDYTNKTLKYAWFDGSNWQMSVVDPVYGRASSLAILPSGQPAISYWDVANEALKYAWYDGSTWHMTTIDSKGTMNFYSSLAILPSGQPAIGYLCDTASEDLLKCAIALDITPAPVELTATYTATAHTELGGANTVPNGPAYNLGETTLSECGAGAFASSSVSFETTLGGHSKGIIGLTGVDGLGACVDWDPEFGCFYCEELSSGDANGTVTGTIVLGTSESYPAGSSLDLDLALEVLVGGDPGDAEDYRLKVWRGVSLLGQIDPCAPNNIVVPVLAGETLTFELFASEEDWAGDYEGYDREFEFRMILRGPANFDGKGAVDFRDYAIFALRWLDTGCSAPNWCGKADFNKSGDVNWPDLKIFTDHWLE